MEPKYTLKVDAGSYASNSLVHLLWIVLSHRLHHFMKGEGFRD